MSRQPTPPERLFVNLYPDGTYGDAYPTRSIAFSRAFAECTTYEYRLVPKLERVKK